MNAVRWLKPPVFVLCLLPAIRMTLGALNATGVTHVPGIDLGADPVKELLHTCGSWTLNFVLITLCMTPLRDITHSLWWLRFRRMFGLFAYFYVLAHLGVYLFLDQSGNFSALWQDVLKRPYITLGMLAFVLLTPLALTSTAWAQRRLRRRWTALHRLIYPIAILGVWHYWWLVKRDVRPPLLYALGVAVLLGYRLWKYARRGQRVSAVPLAASGEA